MRVVLVLMMLITLACCMDSEVSPFFKQLYKALGDRDGDVQSVVDAYRGRFQALDTDGHLGAKLTALLDIRVLDLETSLKHIRTMYAVIGALSQG